MNQLNTLDAGFEASQYEDTEGFVRALSKYYKMSQICGAENIKNCFPYSTIKYMDNQGNEKEVNVKDLKIPESFKLSSDKWLPPAGFISAQGTPFIMLLNKSCTRDTEEAMRAIPTSCISYMYDRNGSNNPNKLGNDIAYSGIGLSGLKAVLGGVKIMTDAFRIPTGLSLSECQAEMAKADEYKAINSKVYIKYCQDFSSNGGDRWAYAMKYCKEQGYHLPTEQQLVDMANALYKGMSATTGYGDTYAGKDTNNQYYTIGSNEPLPEALNGLGSSSWVYLWSGNDGSSYITFNRGFTATYSYRIYSVRAVDQNPPIRAVCVAD